MLASLMMTVVAVHVHAAVMRVVSKVGLCVCFVSCESWLFISFAEGRAQSRLETLEVPSLSSRVFVEVYLTEPG
jgi:hypothetical protein